MVSASLLRKHQQHQQQQHHLQQLLLRGEQGGGGSGGEEGEGEGEEEEEEEEGLLQATGVGLDLENGGGRRGGSSLGSGSSNYHAGLISALPPLAPGVLEEGEGGEWI